MDNDTEKPDRPRMLAKLLAEKDGTLRQLDTQKDKRRMDAPYRELNVPETILIEHFEQRKRPPDTPRRNNKPKPRKTTPSNRVAARLALMPITIEGVDREAVATPGEKRPQVLTILQFETLYNAIASVSGWWPLADSRWDSRSYFDKLEKYVLYLDDMPIGFGALDRNNDGENTARIVFVGLIASMQGKKFGNALFDDLNDFAWRGGTEKVVLNTAPEYDLMKGGGKAIQKSAADLYRKKGFAPVKKEMVNVNDLMLGDKNVYKLNLPDYYKDNYLLSEEYLLKRLKTAFHCYLPELPSKPPGGKAPTISP